MKTFLLELWDRICSWCRRKPKTTAIVFPFPEVTPVEPAKTPDELRYENYTRAQAEIRGRNSGPRFHGSPSSASRELRRA
jgi:hypothetical protein